MNNLSFLNITEIKSTDGRTIKCTYIDYPLFSFECNPCIELHYIFLKFSLERTYTAGYSLRKSILNFLDFTSEYNARNTPILRLDSITQINTEVFKSYKNFLLKLKLPILNAEVLKTALVITAQEDGNRPIPQLPVSIAHKEKPTEPLSEDAFSDLSNKLKKHIDKLYAKIKFRKEVEKATAYDYEEVIAEAFPAYNKKNIFRWYQYKEAKQKKVVAKTLTNWLSQSTDNKLRQSANDPDILKKFHSLYSKEGKPYLLPEPHNPFAEIGIRN